MVDTISPRRRRPTWAPPWRRRATSSGAWTSSWTNARDDPPVARRRAPGDRRMIPALFTRMSRRRTRRARRHGRAQVGRRRRWAARELGSRVADGIGANGQSADVARRVLKDCYGAAFHELLDACADEDILRIARRATRGVHMASPVFDGASEEEIFGLLEQAELPSSGQTTLYDGRTGSRSRIR